MATRNLDKAAGDYYDVVKQIKTHQLSSMF